MNAYFLPNNLGKESITLNLLDQEGQALLHRLIQETPIDIFATNQRPDSYKKLGIDYETLSVVKPDLIWVGITGFGPTNNEAAYDPILQARAGFMELTGDPDGDPMVFGLPMVDLGAGEHAYGLVMKSLYQRAVTGDGVRLDISMFQSAVSWMVSPVMLSHSFDVRVTRHGNTHQFFAPVSVYPTSDGYVYLAVGNDRQWEALTGQAGSDRSPMKNISITPGVCGSQGTQSATDAIRNNKPPLKSPIYTRDRCAGIRRKSHTRSLRHPLIIEYLVRRSIPALERKSPSRRQQLFRHI
jgi:crotonobetainyl-CoA:carnitine CoA-transferase CaiB-like acyl-CoA transferase